MELALFIKLTGGLVYLLAGGDLLVRGAVALARRFHVSPIVIAVATVLSKKHLHRYPVLAFSALPMIYGGVAHAILWLLFERDRPLDWNWTGVGSIAYLTVFGSMMMSGDVAYETVMTSHGDLMIVTSEKPEMVKKLQKWAAKNKTEMAKYEEKGHEGHAH